MDNSTSGTDNPDVGNVNEMHIKIVNTETPTNDGAKLVISINFDGFAAQENLNSNMSYTFDIPPNEYPTLLHYGAQVNAKPDNKIDFLTLVEILSRLAFRYKHIEAAKHVSAVNKHAIAQYGPKVKRDMMHRESSSKNYAAIKDEITELDLEDPLSFNYHISNDYDSSKKISPAQQYMEAIKIASEAQERASALAVTAEKAQNDADLAFGIAIDFAKKAETDQAMVKSILDEIYRFENSKMNSDDSTSHTATAPPTELANEYTSIPHSSEFDGTFESIHPVLKEWEPDDNMMN